MMDDPFDLKRFVDAQADTYDRALSEIRHGAKQGHWMWFIFPQLAGLGRSATAKRYAIRSLDEAVAYLDHPLLGDRYCACVHALQAIPGGTAQEVFGPVDAIKLRSSLTLFGQVDGGVLIEAAIRRWCGGRDPATMRLLGHVESLSI